MKTTYENGDPIITIVPIEIVMDRRLSLAQVRVLIALCSLRHFDGSFGDKEIERLPERCLYKPEKVKVIISELSDLGWIVSDGDDSYRISSGGWQS